MPILFGMIATVLSGRVNALAPVDFAHLSERAMLYVVFTFGEMIISLASYFTGELTAGGMYFSAMAFLIVVGLFLSYGTLYNRIIDRETSTTGTLYMLLHIFLIFALNNISAALEFMGEEVDLTQKTVLITGSFILYFAFMLMIAKYARRSCAISGRYIAVLCAMAVCFAVLMMLLRGRMYANIAVTVIFIYGIYLMMHMRAVKAGSVD